MAEGTARGMDPATTAGRVLLSALLGARRTRLRGRAHWEDVIAEAESERWRIEQRDVHERAYRERATFDELRLEGVLP